jgi:hypothetical protein
MPLPAPDEESGQKVEAKRDQRSDSTSQKPGFLKQAGFLSANIDTRATDPYDPLPPVVSR